MNHYTIYELLWLFFLYSFGGWILETVLATLKQKKFANRGLVNGPYCVMYGFTAVLMTAGTDWILAFPFCGSLCNGCRVDRRTSDGVDL